MHDSLGDRMKTQYENRTRYSLPRRTYTILRVDGKAFHTFTRGLARPYDVPFMDLMAGTALALAKEIMGAEFGYVQSDEISLLLTDFRKDESQGWFDGNLQKIVSVAASVATMEFNRASRAIGYRDHACFDCRAFTIPDWVEVANYFLWRQNDAERNSVQMLAQGYASPKQLHGKAIPQQHDLIHDAGDNWNNHPAKFKRGQAIIYEDMAWRIVEPPIFTQDREWLKRQIPVLRAEDFANFPQSDKNDAATTGVSRAREDGNRLVKEFKPEASR